MRMIAVEFKEKGELEFYKYICKLVCGSCNSVGYLERKLFVG